MILAILTTIVLIIYGIIKVIREHDWHYFWLTSMTGSILCGFLILMFAALVGESISPNENIYKETTLSIVALEDNISTNGTFFLGTGYVNENMNYYYMIENDQGYHLQWIKASEAYIKYDTTPHIEIKRSCGFKHWYNNIWAFPMHTYYTIYVPEGTILNNYNIDLK